MFSATETSSSRPARLRSSGTRYRPRSIAARGRPAATGAPATRTVPASSAVDAEQRARQLGAARADEAGEAEDLALAARCRLDRLAG